MTMMQAVAFALCAGLISWILGNFGGHYLLIWFSILLGLDAAARIAHLFLGWKLWKNQRMMMRAMWEHRNDDWLPDAKPPEGA